MKIYHDFLKIEEKLKKKLNPQGAVPPPEAPSDKRKLKLRKNSLTTEITSLPLPFLRPALPLVASSLEASPPPFNILLRRPYTMVVQYITPRLLLLHHSRPSPIMSATFFVGYPDIRFGFHSSRRHNGLNFPWKKVTKYRSCW